MASMQMCAKLQATENVCYLTLYTKSTLNKSHLVLFTGKRVSIVDLFPQCSIRPGIYSQKQYKTHSIKLCLPVDHTL